MVNWLALDFKKSLIILPENKVNIQLLRMIDINALKKNTMQQNLYLYLI